MQERRKEERISISANIEVVDRLYDERIGILMDISPRGIRIKAEDPIEAYEEIKLRLLLPKKILGQKSISATATCVWCKPDDEPDRWQVGFEFYKVSQQDASAIIGLILETKRTSQAPTS